MVHTHTLSPQPEELMACVDGDASAEAMAGIYECAECSATVTDYNRLQVGLRQMLTRFDCPSPHGLGEYALDLVSPAERTAVAAHVLECDDCALELKGLRAYLSVEPLISDHVGWRANVRRIVAQLVSSQPMAAQVVAFRNVEQAPVLVYQTDAVQISVTQTPGERPGAICLDGLVVRRSPMPEPLAHSEVVLVPIVGPPLSTWTDELGNFMYDELDGGTFRLELSMPDEVIVVGELRLGP
jgi:hypothetical protein